MAITVNDVPGLDELADKNGWVEVFDSVDVAATADALKMAEASGVDISLITGTGKNGKVLVGDVRAFIEGE